MVPPFGGRLKTVVCSAKEMEQLTDNTVPNCYAEKHVLGELEQQMDCGRLCGVWEIYCYLISSIRKIINTLVT